MCKELQYGNDSISLTVEEKKLMIEDAAGHYANFLKALKFTNFENDPNKAHFNVERRKSEGVDLPHQKNISKYQIDHMSRKYGDMLRSGTKTIPIWTK